jgi:hypothetical protein
MCVENGMVSVHKQAIVCPCKGKHIVDTFELKVPEESLEEHLHKIRHISTEDREEYSERKRKA